MTKTYTGKVVLLERAQPTDKYSSYYDGSYLIHAETGNQLFGYGLREGLGVYGLGGFHSGKQFPLAGAGAYTVVSVDDPEPWMLEALDRAEQEIRAVHAGEKKAAWIMSVYDQAESAVTRLRKILEAALLEAHCDAEVPTVRVIVPPGVKVHLTQSCS